VLSQRTSEHLAKLDQDARASAETLEVSKLKEQQDARRQQFMAEHLPQILSSNESDRQIGQALLFTIYPDEAAEILKRVLPLANEAGKQALEIRQQQAQALQVATGDWSIIISGDKTIQLAKKWADTAANLGYTPVSIYLRDGFYRVAVGNYPTRQLADQAAVTVRPRTRPDAYVVALGNWCPSHNNETRNPGEAISCGKE
jgi:hypothetical protein